MRTQREGRDEGRTREPTGTRAGFSTRGTLITGLVGIAGLTGGLLAAPAEAVAPTSAPAAGHLELDGLSGQEIADRAKGELKTMKSVRMKLESDSMTLALTLDRRGDCTGRADMGGQGSITLAKKGHTVWLKPDRAFWKSQVGGGGGAAVADFVDGRYIKGTTDDELMAGMDTTCDLDTLRNSVDTASGSDGQRNPGDPGGPGKWKRGGAQEYRHQDAVAVNRGASDSRMTMLVSDEGKPYPLKLTRSGQGSTETIDLGRFDEPVPDGTPSKRSTLGIAELEEHLDSPSDAPSSGESV